MADSRTSKPRRARNDVILIAALLLVAALGAVYLFVFRPGGDMVQVTIDGKAYGTYSLSEDRVEEISSDLGHNRLVIQDGKATMQDATCPDGICVAHAAIFRVGESIVCLPNRVVVTVINASDTDAPDIVT